MEFEIRPTDDPRPGHEMGIVTAMTCRTYALSLAGFFNCSAIATLSGLVPSIVTMRVKPRRSSPITVRKLPTFAGRLFILHAH